MPQRAEKKLSHDLMVDVSSVILHKSPRKQRPNTINMKMSFLTVLAGLLFFTTLVQGQQRLKMATVSMERLFNEYYQTAKIQREINIDRARIQRDNNDRLANIREIDSKLQNCLLYTSPSPRDRG